MSMLLSLITHIKTYCVGTGANKRFCNSSS